MEKKTSLLINLESSDEEESQQQYSYHSNPYRRNVFEEFKGTRFQKFDTFQPYYQPNEYNDNNENEDVSLDLSEGSVEIVEKKNDMNINNDNNDKENKEIKEIDKEKEVNQYEISDDFLLFEDTTPTTEFLNTLPKDSFTVFVEQLNSNERKIERQKERDELLEQCKTSTEKKSKEMKENDNQMEIDEEFIEVPEIEDKFYSSKKKSHRCDTEETEEEIRKKLEMYRNQIEELQRLRLARKNAFDGSSLTGEERKRKINEYLMGMKEKESMNDMENNENECILISDDESNDEKKNENVVEEIIDDETSDKDEMEIVSVHQNTFTNEMNNNDITAIRNDNIQKKDDDDCIVISDEEIEHQIFHNEYQNDKDNKQNDNDEIEIEEENDNDEIEMRYLENDKGYDFFKDDNSKKVSTEITEQEYNTRINLLQRRIISIDREETRIRDDAFHIEQLDDDTFEIGIHTVDSSQFGSIPKKKVFKLLQNFFENNHLPDSEKKQMFYLDNYTRYSLSLDAGQERRALSLILLFDSKGRLKTNPTLFQSIIKIRCNLNYQQFEGMISNPMNGDPFKWSSYGLKTYENTGKLFNITLPQLKTDLTLINKIISISVGKENESMMNGKDFVWCLGLLSGKYVGSYLFQSYREYSILIGKRYKHITSFRSPLRKFLDYCVVKQLVSAIKRHTIDDMLNTFFQFDDRDMITFIGMVTDYYNPVE